MRITVDQDKCIAASECLIVAPEVFDQRDEDGIVVLLNPSPDTALAEDVKQAAALCPGRAITVED
jgi:ferredoxin